ncbi:hypothetical protein NC653_000925 [Populus alba x Populus x berolinensis]|uniref:Uncharacterized protein n=1 Tax=Populus alba x Populus x berolinensis TaxID=444605 RepID=A0AAD6RJS4_9ROSI|nr:hypothetical protein NC653_000925 [Populus alba x Populus x berolinensis]
MSLEYPNEGCGDNGDNGGTLNIPMVSPSQNPFQLDGVNGSEATALTSLSGEEISLFTTLLVIELWSSLVLVVEVLQRSSRLEMKLSMEAKSVKRCCLMSSNVEASSKDAITIERRVASPLFFSKRLLLKGEIKDESEVVKPRLEFKEEERREESRAFQQFLRCLFHQRQANELALDEAAIIHLPVPTLPTCRQAGLELWPWRGPS